MRRWLAFLVLAAVALARPARADDVVASPPPPPALRNALSVHVLTLFSAGVALQYERQLVRWVSVATSIGHRWSGGDSFATDETSFGWEARFWILGRVPFVRWQGRAMVGPYIGVRLDGGITRVSEGDRLVGSTMTFGQSLAAGARLVFAHRFEVTPYASAGLRHELDPRGRLARQTHIDWARFGLTAGVMF